MNIATYLHDEASITEFERKILWFKSHFNIISANDLREVLYENRKIRNFCLITVDDGWRSTYEIIYPVMKKHGLPFTIFVSPYVCKANFNFWYHSIKFYNEAEFKDIIVKDKLFLPEIKEYPLDLILKELPIEKVYDLIANIQSLHPEIEVPRGFMNTAEIMELQKSGLVEIGAHTMIHPILAAESFEVANQEVMDSVNELSDVLSAPVKSFAYPNGLKDIDFTKRDIDIVKRHGIDLAFSVNPGVISSSSDPLALPRWGSIARLKFGRLGQFLPSRANQKLLRDKIKKLKIYNENI